MPPPWARRSRARRKPASRCSPGTATSCDKDKGLRIAYVGTHNYDIGVNLAKQVQQIKPKGGVICIQSGGAAAANHNERMQGIRDTLAGKKSAAAPGERLTGQNGWTEADGCPLYTDDDFPRSVQQMEDILGKYPTLDAFVPTGGFPQFIPQAYRKVAEKYKARIAGRLARARRRRYAPRPDGPSQGWACPTDRSANGLSRWATRA